MRPPELRHCFYCGEALAKGVAPFGIVTCDKPACKAELHAEIQAARPWPRDPGGEKEES